MNENQVESAIQEAGLTAPRLTPQFIDSCVKDEQYYIFPGTQVTVCCITLVNGFNVVGESACASPENFNEEIGRALAFSNARDKIWALEGYLLKDKLHNAA